MTRFTVLHHGVPLGVAFTAPESETNGPNPFALNMMEFEPAPAYESVRPLARLAADSIFGWFFGPHVVDLDAADGALPEAETMWAALELADVHGNPVAGRVVWLIEQRFGGKPAYWVDVELNDPDTDSASPPQMLPHRFHGIDRLPPNAW